MLFSLVHLSSPSLAQQFLQGYGGAVLLLPPTKNLGVNPHIIITPGRRGDVEEHKPKQNSKDGKPVCKYGAACYRVNPDHLKQFWHPPRGSNSSTSGNKLPSGAGSGEEDELSEEQEEEPLKRPNNDMENKVQTLRSMQAFRGLEPGIIHDVLEANKGSLHLTMEALKQLTSASDDDDK